MTTDTNQHASLGQIHTVAELHDFFDLNSDNALWREIDLADHSAAAVIVWRMQPDAERSPVEEAQAERLVACWNACQGIPTEKLHELLVDPAWEPLTPEVLARLQDGPPRTKYWLAPKARGMKPCPGYTVRTPGAGGVCFDAGAAGLVYASELTHIMPFHTPEMPS